MIRFPVWYRTVAAVGGGIAEEILFRGFSVTRLAMLTGPIWLATVINLVGFNLLHVAIWGWGFALEGLVSGAVAMAFFIWRKDLLTTMVFHISTDAIGIVICANVHRMVEKTDAVLTAIETAPPAVMEG